MSGETIPDKYTEWEGEVGNRKIKTFHGEVSINGYTLDLFTDPEKSIGIVILRLLRSRRTK